MRRIYRWRRVTNTKMAVVSKMANCFSVDVGSPTIRSGRCGLAGFELRLRVYADWAHAKQALAAADSLWCPFQKSAMGISELNSADRVASISERCQRPEQWGPQRRQ